MFYIECYYAEQDYITGHKPVLRGECSTAYGFYLAFGILPFWFRFAQCLNKYRATEAKVHLINAGKYFLSILPGVLVIWVHSAAQFSGLRYEPDTIFWTYFAVSMIKTIYCFIWDIYMDWGLCRSNKRGDPHRFLRAKINYAPCFYYWAIISDFILRFVFIVFLINVGQPDSSFNRLDAMFALQTFAEGFRRA